MEKLIDAIGIVLFESEKFGGERVIGGGLCPTLRANKTSAGVIEVMADVKVLGSLDQNFDSTGRIYDVGGCSPTLSTMQGGNQEPKILEAKTIRMVRTDEGKVMRKQCENHEIRHGFNEHRKPEPREDYISNTLSTVQKDNIVCCAMRGRNPDNPSDRTTGSPTEQRLELGTPGVSNCLTSVQKDNMVLVKQATKQGYAECKVGGVADLSFPDSAMRRGRVQDGGEICPTIMSQNQELCRIEQMYRIRKLTPRECGRLMGVSDEDIDKMAAANSNSQLYKQFGNSIVVDVMCHMFRNLNIKQE